MTHKIKKIQPSDLEQAIKEGLSFWAKPDLLQCYARRDGVELYYLCAEKNGNISAVMPILEKKKYGLRFLNQLPEQFYTSIDFLFATQKHLFNVQDEQLKIIQSFASYLKKSYPKVILKFAVNIKDVRGFQWAGFDVSPLYTYRKDIGAYSKESLPSATKRQLRKATDANLYARECWDLPLIQPLAKYSADKKQREARQASARYLDFVTDIYQQKLCTKYVVFKDDEPVAFQIVLKDEKAQNLYLLMIGTAESGYQLGGNIFCFDHIFTHNQNFLHYDLSGANIENVAYFKAQFNCDLVHFFQIQKKVFDIF